MAKELQYFKNIMNESLKSGYFWIDWQLHLYTEMVSSLNRGGAWKNTIIASAGFCYLAAG